MENNYTFNFKNTTYQLTDKWEETCVNDSKAFQLLQFEHLLKTHDYITLENRINNQLKFGYLQKIS